MAEDENEIIIGPLLFRFGPARFDARSEPPGVVTVFASEPDGDEPPPPPRRAGLFRLTRDGWDAFVRGATL